MRKPKSPKLVSVAVMTTITIIFWIFFTLYQVLSKDAPPSIDAALLEPIDPNMNTEVLGSFNGKVFFEEGSFAPPVNQPDINIASPTPVPSETPVPSVTNAPEVSASPTENPLPEEEI